MESEVPSRKPGILPGIRHGDDMVRLEVAPVVVASMPPRTGGCCLVAFQPVGNIIVKELLVPYHACQCLAQDTFILNGGFGEQGREKSISFCPTLSKNLILTGKWLRQGCGRQHQINRSGLAWLNSEFVNRSEFGSLLRRIYCRMFTVHQVAMKCIFDIRPGIGRAP